ncbi:hypothetical protein FACS189452_01600 [Bacteroidia bacterium]|nr:hypothetical protein FACS189452_01600 [Bacteroidia bacterium]
MKFDKQIVVDMITKEFKDTYLNEIICADCLATMKEMPNDSVVTKKQIERQDFVDNAIFELLQTVNPSNKEFDWDIEMIGDIRDAIQHYIIKKTDCSEQEFYPYIEE